MTAALIGGGRGRGAGVRLAKVFKVRFHTQVLRMVCYDGLLRQTADGGYADPIARRSCIFRCQLVFALQKWSLERYDYF